MFTLIGSALGFLGSFAPKILDFFQDRADKKHELDMMDKQIEGQKRIAESRVRQALVEGEYEEVQAAHKEHSEVTQKASQWVINLSASVRPIITYAFFFEFVLVSIALFAGWITEDEYKAVWNEEMRGLFATIISFWFGQRLVKHWEASKNAKG